jgi:hypothetical protein
MDQLIQLIEEVEKAKKNPFINVRHSHEYMSESHRVKMRGEWDIHAHIFKIELPEKVYGKQISREQQEFTRLDRRIGKLSRLASRTVEHFITLRPGTDRKACEEEASIELCKAFLQDYKEALKNLDNVDKTIMQLEERQEQLISLMLEKSE